VPAVVVVGSGAAGLAAAVGAATAGADVVVLEAADAVGGTTALSGGIVWVPGHRFLGAGARDDVRRARTYLGALATGDVEPALVDAFLSRVGPVVDELAECTPLQWEVLEHWPDYRDDVEGAAQGRSLWPCPLTLDEDLAAVVQRDPVAEAGGHMGPVTERLPRSDAVVLRGPVRGRTLVGGLLAGSRKLGAEVRTGARAGGLVLRGDAVCGVRVGGEVLEGRVVLASGGFQFDASAVRAFVGGAPLAPLGTPSCRGDALAMSRHVGADLGNMTEAWWMPALSVPGESLDGAPYFRPLHGERAKPGAVLVDRLGRRFVDEAQNYGDVGRAMRRFATGQPPYPAAPSFLVLDAAYRARYPVGPLEPNDPDPEWLLRGSDLGELARAMGVPAETLAATVARFNAGARHGRDEDFGRGASAYDRWIGDHAAADPTLAPVEEPPFYAAVVHAGCLGTKGGPRTDEAGRVLRRSAPVAGLYAAGNAAASPFGTATAAGGATLGPALAFGHLAGRAAAEDR